MEKMIYLYPGEASKTRYKVHAVVSTLTPQVDELLWAEIQVQVGVSSRVIGDYMPGAHCIGIEKEGNNDLIYRKFEANPTDCPPCPLFKANDCKIYIRRVKERR